MNIRYRRVGKDWEVKVTYKGVTYQCTRESRLSASRGAMWHTIIRACTLGDLPRGPRTDQTFKAA